MKIVRGQNSKLNISVRNLVEFVFREGDIDHRSGKLASPDAMFEGSRLHRKIQKSMGKGYESEVFLKYTVREDLYELTIEGRADGVFRNDEGQICVDEIKAVYKNLDKMEEAIYVQKAQAMCYAYMYAVEHDIEKIAIRMSYCHMETEEMKYFHESFSFQELKEWFDDVIHSYKKWADFQFEWRNIRQASIENLEFPYPYREGQKKLVSDVYRTIYRKKNLFLQAPTGVGKTISTIFPAVKAVGEELADRIFYLTAKTITATVAKESFQLLSQFGYKAKIIQLTAKEKLCLCQEMECNPIQCPYAKGHYDRVNDAVFDLLQKKDSFSREDLIEQAEQFQVCPFEMSLDVASWADDIICDYNYVFDPNVALKRFFQNQTRRDYIFLVDEAHNLADRAREMYSAVLYKEDFLAVRKIMKNDNRYVVKQLDRCNKILLDYKRNCETYSLYQNIATFVFALIRLYGALEEILQKSFDFPSRKEVIEFYFNLRRFLMIYELVDDEHYEIYAQIEENGKFSLKLFCVDPSENLQKCIDKGRATIFFSATLLPVQYYKNLLSTDQDNYAIYANSVFSSEQRLLLVARDVSTKYTRRNEKEFEKIASYISQVIMCKKGNYIVFFPSYKFMNEVYCKFEEINKKQVFSVLQKTGMNEADKEQFLLEFEEERDRSFVAFCVMGGVFSEGIDLTRDKLIGAIVVGTGFPQISNEREILKRHYDEQQMNGFDYAYRFPGMNKVLQSAGRVIRTTEDRGIILLLDERFLDREYQGLYPREWEDRKSCNLDSVTAYVHKFWNQ